MSRVANINPTGPLAIWLVTPSLEITSWLKKIAFTYNITPQTVSRIVTQDKLNLHSIPFLFPKIEYIATPDSFINQNLPVIFERVLASWNFSQDIWPKERDHEAFRKMFILSYYPLVINMLGPDIANESVLKNCSVTVVTGKAAALMWLESLVHKGAITKNNNITLNINALKKIGGAFLMPIFSDHEGKEDFIKNYCNDIFQCMLAFYCEDPSQWPEDLSYKNFVSWFDCNNFYPIYNLLLTTAINQQAV